MANNNKVIEGYEFGNVGARRTPLFRFVCRSITQHVEATSNRSSASSLRERGQKKPLEHRSDGTNECHECRSVLIISWAARQKFFFRSAAAHLCDMKSSSSPSSIWRLHIRKLGFYVPFCSPLLSNSWQFHSRHKRAARDVKCECIRSPPPAPPLSKRDFCLLSLFRFSPFADDGKKRTEKLIFHPFNSGRNCLECWSQQHKDGPPAALKLPFKRSSHGGWSNGPSSARRKLLRVSSVEINCQQLFSDKWSAQAASWPTLGLVNPALGANSSGRSWDQHSPR